MILLLFMTNTDLLLKISAFAPTIPKSSSGMRTEAHSQQLNPR